MLLRFVTLPFSYKLSRVLMRGVTYSLLMLILSLFTVNVQYDLFKNKI